MESERTLIAQIVESAHTKGSNQKTLAARAGLTEETLSRMKKRGSGNITLVANLAKAAGMRLSLVESPEPSSPPSADALRGKPTAKLTVTESQNTNRPQPHDERKQTNAVGRKSTRLGLSFPYDWSNPNISDDALIINVLERGIYKDICRVCAHFGVGTVEQLRVGLPAAIADSPSLGRVLQNVKKGFALAQVR
jgi:hypothetical protein